MLLAHVLPAHEEEHFQEAREAFGSMGDPAVGHWDRASHLFENAQIEEVFLLLDRLREWTPLSEVARADVKLQLVRCLRRNAPGGSNGTNTLLVAETEYQQVIRTYREGIYYSEKGDDLERATSLFDTARKKARELDSRPWECAAQLEMGHAKVLLGRLDDAMEDYTRVFNLSRRNGLVEYIPRAVMGKGNVHIHDGGYKEAIELFNKAHDLARRNELEVERYDALAHLAKLYHKKQGYYGLALEYYREIADEIDDLPVWPAEKRNVQQAYRDCQDARSRVDLAKLLGPMPTDELQRRYLMELVNSFVGIPGIGNRSELGERVGLTRQAIHRNISQD